MWSFRINSRIGLIVEFDPLANELSELLGSRDGLETAIEFDRCRKAAVSQHSPDRLIISRVVLEINRRRSVSKLMDRNSQADGFLNTLCDLLAEQEPVLRLTGFARKQPAGIRSP